MNATTSLRGSVRLGRNWTQRHTESERVSSTVFDRFALRGALGRNENGKRSWGGASVERNCRPEQFAPIVQRIP